MNISRLLLFIFLPLLVFTIFFHPINAINQDLGRHILFGKIIVQTHAVPKINLLSYTNPDFPFINTHWFSEVLFYLIENVMGFLGLLLITTLVATGAYLLQLLYVKNAKAVPIIIASLFYFQILLDRTDVRPEIFSFFFLSLFIVILYTYRRGFTKWIYILPFVELIWVNTHIYFPIGLLVLGLFLLDRLITQRKKIASKETIILATIFIISSIVTLINPNTLHGALYPLFVFQNYGFEIEENHTIFDIWNLYQQKSAILYFFISVPLLFSVLLLNLKKTKPIDWFLAISFTIIAASAERNLPLFVFSTFIACITALNNLYAKFPLGQVFNYRRMVLYIVVGLFIVWQTISLVMFNPFGYSLSVGASKAVDFLQKNHIAGQIFNNFDIGSYLAYRLYPQERVFVDGRPEAYPASFFQQEYIPIEQNKSLFQQADNKYHFNIIFIAYTDVTPWNQQFLRDINANPLWRLVYLDPLIVIYVKNIPQNHSIKSNAILHSAQLTPLQLTKDELNHLLIFYENIGWTNEIKTVDLKLLALDPNSCAVLANLGTFLENENDPGYVVYATKYQSTCR